MTVPAVTAEWVCTRCGTINRKLGPADADETEDRCHHCRAKHEVERGKRKVFWDAELD